LLPLVCVLAFILFPEPVKLIKIAGLTQAAMLPMLGYAAIHFRRNVTDERLRPGKLWDAALGISTVALLLAAGWGVWKSALDLLPK
ncbi:MAG: transmembrane Mn(2+) transporter, partial [Planctomycetaceae bacterium]